MISQNEATVFLVFGMALMFFLMLSIMKARQIYEHIKLEYQYMKHPRLVEYSALRACEDPHEWQVAALALRGLPVGKYHVCMKCGSIQGREDVMCSAEVLAQMKEALEIALKQKNAEREAHERITALTQSYVDAYIARNFPNEVNDVEFAERLRGIAKYTLTAMADASEKVAAELQAQVELEKRYGGWANKIKGNA